MGYLTSQKRGESQVGWRGWYRCRAAQAMGCCQDKDLQTSKEAESGEVEEEDTEGVDVDSSDQNPRANKSLLITVLWRRLSMFSRRGSTRSNRRRQSIQNQKHERMLQNNPKEVLEEPEKG